MICPLLSRSLCPISDNANSQPVSMSRIRDAGFCRPLRMAKFPFHATKAIVPWWSRLKALKNGSLKRAISNKKRHRWLYCNEQGLKLFYSGGDFLRCEPRGAVCIAFALGLLVAALFPYTMAIIIIVAAVILVLLLILLFIKLRTKMKVR